MVFSEYRLPEGTIVKVDETVAKGAPALTFQRANREIVVITRVATLEQWLAMEKARRWL